MLLREGLEVDDFVRRHEIDLFLGILQWLEVRSVSTFYFI